MLSLVENLRQETKTLLWKLRIIIFGATSLQFFNRFIVWKQKKFRTLSKQHHLKVSIHHISLFSNFGFPFVIR